MKFNKAYNNYRISLKEEEKSPLEIDAYIIDIQKRKILCTKVLNSAQFFIEKNKFFKNDIIHFEFNSKKKQVAIFSIDDDLIEKNQPFIFQNKEIYSDCLICSYVKDKYDLRKSKLTYEELSSLIIF